MPAVWLQELRSERLDHEHHDMRETHEPAGAVMDQAIPRLAGDNASGRAEDYILLHKTFAHSANVLRKR
jgi:hypothetical protein